jgi:WD40 repeat protein
MVLQSGPNQSRLWDMKNERALGEPFSCLQALYSPDGAAILALGNDRQVRLLDAANGSLLAPPIFHDGVLGGGCFDASGQRAAWWGGQTIRLADIARRKLDGPELEFPRREGVAFRPDGKVLFSWRNGEVRRWDAATGAPLGDAWHFPGYHQIAVAFPAKGDTVVVGASQVATPDNQGKLWERDLDGKQVGPALELPQALLTLGFFPRSTNLLIATTHRAKTDAGEIRSWDWATKQPAGPAIRFPAVRGAVAGADGQTILAWRDSSWQLWHRSTGLPLTPPFHNRVNLVAASFGASPRTVLVRDFANNLRVVNVPAPQNGSVEEVVNRVQAATGLELDAAGVVRNLEPEIWRKKRHVLGKN